MGNTNCRGVKVSTIDGVSNESNSSVRREAWRKNDVDVSDNVESAIDNCEIEDSAPSTTLSEIGQTEEVSRDCSNVCSLSSEVVRLKEELSARTDELNTMQTYNDNLQASCEDYQSDIKMLAISNQKNEEKCSQFADQLRSAKGELEQRGNECGKYFHEKCILQKSLNSLQEEVTRLNEVNQQVEEVRLEYEVQEQHLKDTKNEVTELKCELEREKSSTVKLQTQVRDCESRILEMENEERRFGREAWAENDAKTTELCESVADAHERMKKRVLKLEETLSEKEQQEAEVMENLEEKEKKIKQLESNLQKRDKKACRLNSEVRNCKTICDVRQVENIKSNEKIKELRRSNAELTASLSQYRKIKNDFILQKKNLREQLEEKQNELKTLVQANDELRNENIALVQGNKQNKLELDNLLEESQELGEENSQMKERSRLLQEEKNENEIKHKHRTDEMARELEILQKERQTLEDKMKAVYEENTKINEQNYLLEEEKSDIEKKNADLVAQVTLLENQLRYQTELDQRRVFIEWFVEKMRHFDPRAQGLDASGQDVIVHVNHKPLGQGAWCIVYQGSFGNTPVAVKSFHPLLRESAEPNSENLKFDKEIIFGFVCRHPNIVQILSHTIDMKMLGPLLLMEKMCLSLFDLITHEIGSAPIEDIPWDVDYDGSRLSIARDVSLAVEYLHNRADPILHRDVSAKNVLLYVRGTTWCAKLSDFGTATLQSCTTKEENPGCPRYIAPEAGTPSRQTPKGATPFPRPRFNSTELNTHNVAHVTPTKPLISNTVLSTAPALSTTITVPSSLKVTPITTTVARKVGNFSRSAGACKDGWLAYYGACYKLYGVTRGQSWRQANRSCHAVNAALVSIYSSDENKFVFSVVTQGGSKWAWIGLSDLLAETRFQWSADNSLVNYTHWNKGEPNDGDSKGEDCVYIGIATTWNDSPCDTVVPFVCKYCPT